jgi:DNA-binding beta-propeller fold protein YncE
MKSNTKNLQGIRAIVFLVVLVLMAELGFNAPTHAADSLYIGDATDNTVKAFDADNGAFQGEFVKKGNSPIKGPMGLIFDSEGNLLVSNQNVGANKSGEILKFDGPTGKFLGELVRHNDPNAPFAPRGIVLGLGNVLFVASQSGEGKDAPPGNLLAYTKDGVFLADLTPDHNKEFPGAFSTREFHPRGVVLGPDGLLYVSVCDDLDPKSANFNPDVTPLQGSILRFDPNNNGAFVDVFASYPDCPDLHRPEGLVFGPDGKLYVTAFRKDDTDTDKILILVKGANGKGACVDKIDLDHVGQPRAFAQALLFGPGGLLFVPISGGGPDTGAVRRYSVSTKTRILPDFVLPAAEGGPLGAGWYLTFGKTHPGTLTYNP